MDKVWNIEISPKSLAVMMDLPEGCVIVGTVWNDETNSPIIMINEPCVDISDMVH